MKMASHFWRVITTGVFLKHPGCINTMANIISPTQLAIPILSVMLLAIILTGHLNTQGRILNPVVGWTSHHSICAFNDKWYLFYHDSSLSKGVTHLRSVKMTGLTHDANGKIHTIDAYED